MEERWRSYFGDKSTRRIVSLLFSPPFAIHALVNSVKGSNVQRAIKQLKKANIQAEPGELPDTLTIPFEQRTDFQPGLPSCPAPLAALRQLIAGHPLIGELVDTADFKEGEQFSLIDDSGRIVAQLKYSHATSMRPFWRRWHTPAISKSRAHTRGEIAVFPSGTIAAASLMQPRKGEKTLVSSPSPAAALALAIMNPEANIEDLRPRPFGAAFAKRERARLGLQNLVIREDNLGWIMDHPNSNRYQNALIDLSVSNIGRRPLFDLTKNQFMRAVIREKAERVRRKLANNISPHGSSGGRVVLFAHSPEPLELLGSEPAFMLDPSWHPVKWPRRLRKFRIARTSRIPTPQGIRDVSDFQFGIMSHRRWDTVTSLGVVRVQRGGSPTPIPYRYALPSTGQAEATTHTTEIKEEVETDLSEMQDLATKASTDALESLEEEVATNLVIVMEHDDDQTDPALPEELETQKEPLSDVNDPHQEEE